MQLRPVHMGGQAVVQCAYDDTGNQVAVKQARRDVGSADDVKLELEAEMIEGLRDRFPHLHDVVLPVLDRGNHEGRRVLVMPWMERRMDEAADLSGFGVRLAMAAAFARSVARMQIDVLGRPTGIVHRDLKPSNAFVQRRDGRLHVWLSDFGGAWTRRAGRPGPAEDLHTAGYAPVDQWMMRHTGGVDPSWDTYAAAVSVFRVLTGQPLGAVQTNAQHISERGKQWLRGSTPGRSPDPFYRLVHIHRMRTLLHADRANLEQCVAEAVDELALSRKTQ
ncbi:MAG: hypothetical protein AAF211_17410, partial [Myxococcota bacterium]